MKHHLRTSPRGRGGKRVFPLVTTLGFVFIWVMAYFLINPFSDDTVRLHSDPYGEPRIRVSNVEWVEESSTTSEAAAPRAASESIDIGGAVASSEGKDSSTPPSSSSYYYSAESKVPTEDMVKQVVEDLEEETIYFGEFEEEDTENAKVGESSSSSSSSSSSLSSSSLGTVAGAPKSASKELTYSDVVEERWFDLDNDQEKNQDAILDFEGDNLGDRYSQETIHESIPRVLHFTWKTDQLDELPELFQKIQLKWRMLNPDWEIKIWTDEECEQMVKDFYPEYYFFYSDFEVTAERSDIWRYLVLDKFGGYYADMDIEPLQPLDELVKLVKDPDCILGLEPEVHAILLYNKYHVIGNAFLGSRPGHPLWKWLIPQSIKRYYSDRNPKDEKDATKITGPIAVDNVIQRNPEVTRSCVLLKPDVTAPAYDITQKPYERCQPILEKQELKYGNEENPYVRICEEIDAVGDKNKDYPPESFMVHHWAHTWQAKPDDTTKTDDADAMDGESPKPKLKLNLEDSQDTAEDGAGAPASQSKEPRIFAQSNIGKEVTL